MSTGVVLVLGGRSDMGLAIAHCFAAKGYAIQLAARRATELDSEKKDLEIRHKVDVTLVEFDALDEAASAQLPDRLDTLPDIAVSVIGYMPEQAESEADPALARTVMRSNFEGPATVFEALGEKFKQRGSGTLVGVSSVAGLRGRASNYIYGAAKAGFSAYLSGMRNKLCKHGVHVITVLPGFVNTKMTAHLDLPAPLTAEPEQVATAIEKAVTKQRNTVYVLPIWQLVMLVIRSIPEFIFKKTNL